MVSLMGTLVNNDSTSNDAIYLDDVVAVKIFMNSCDDCRLKSFGTYGVRILLRNFATG